MVGRLGQTRGEEGQLTYRQTARSTYVPDFRRKWSQGLTPALAKVRKATSRGWETDQRTYIKSDADRIAKELERRGRFVGRIPIAEWNGQPIEFIVYRENPKAQPKTVTEAPTRKPAGKVYPHLTYEKEHDYWRVNQDLVQGGIKWGFDLTDVRKNEWEPFKSRHGFAKVDEAPATKYGHRPVIYMNPSGIFMVAEHESPPQGDSVPLGYMRFEAPQHKEAELLTILKEFRGPNTLQGGGTPSGVADYVKDESPYSANFI